MQDYWDNHPKGTQTRLFVCGSSIGMVEKHFFNYASPLYGRRTKHLKIRPLKFSDLSAFFPDKTFQGLLEIYSVIGGTPAYLLEYEKDIFHTIRSTFLKKMSSSTEMGGWWDGPGEIDIVAINEKTGDVLYCEAKYTERKVGTDTLIKLKRKAGKVKWKGGQKTQKKEYFMIVGKSGFKEKIKMEDVILLDVKGKRWVDTGEK